MRYFYCLSVLAVFFTAFLLVSLHGNKEKSVKSPETSSFPLRAVGEKESSPGEGLDNDWFLTQRSYPYNDLPRNAFQKMRSALRKRFPGASLVDGKNSIGAWTLAGPSNIGGRVNCLSIHPTNPDIIYAGAASGGVWRTTDRGYTWTNIFNESFSIGAIAYDPSDPNVLYVGTGENVPAGVATYPGNGIWRSTDAGASWTNIGLTQIGYTGRIVVNPLNPNVIYVAAIGLYRSKTTERGVYKSTDRGASWNQVLYLNDTTGAVDITMDPADTNRLFASMWTRYRTPHESILTGTASGLYFSGNAGGSWSVVTNGFPHNDANLGRIAVAFAPSNLSIVYALTQNVLGWGGIYKSYDRGASWTKTYDGATAGETQVWWNNVLCVDPGNPNHIWAGMTSLYVSTNGGAFGYASIGGAWHVDQHAMEYAQANHNILAAGNDGGIFISENAGVTWRKSLNLPITQFYAGWIDYQHPQHLLGGTQDNGSVGTSSGVVDGWSEFYGGDGFYCLVDPTDPNYIYAEYQYGGLGYSTDGGSMFNGGTSGINGNDRHNWSQPIAMDVQHPKTLYTGTQRIYRTENHMQSWTALSGDLTFGDGGKVGTITTIDVSPVDPNIVYVGTDDGRVWVSTDRGSTWHDIRGSLPLRWITRVVADPVSANCAYVSLSGFYENDYGGHVYRTTDYGTTWNNIGSSLPDLPVNDLVVDPYLPSHLFIATDLNVLASTNLGATWNVLGSGLPEVSVQDLALSILPSGKRLLAAFTHGRSVYTYTLMETTSTASVTMALHPRWNLISNPLITPNDSVQALFPQAAGNAFAYIPNGSYQVSGRIIHGQGYWLKYPDLPGQSAVITGTMPANDSVKVTAGWNLIGSTGTDVLSTSIVPSGTALQSFYFRYNGGYEAADTIIAGCGYWIKVDHDGTLFFPVNGNTPRVLAHADPFKGMSSLKFTDAAGRTQTVYFGAEPGGFSIEQFEAPPLPPSGAFDVRFATGRIAEFLVKGEAKTIPFLLSSALYPLAIEWKIDAKAGEAQLKCGGQTIPLISSTGKTVVATDGGDVPELVFAALQEIPLQYSLAPNYPNPFNPSTVIRYALPQESRVTLRIYNDLGQIIGTLADGIRNAGSRSVEWDAATAPSGIYFYALDAVSVRDPAVRFSQVRKMILLR